MINSFRALERSGVAGSVPGMSDIAVNDETFDIETADGPMAVLRAWPDGNDSAPVVAFFHDGPGVRDATMSFMRKLAAQGYDVVTPDLFHRRGRMLNFDAEELDTNPAVGAQMFELILSLTDDGIQSDMADALAAVAPKRAGGDIGRCATIGFCLGARAVFRAMTRHPERFVVGAAWHPSWLVDDKPDSPHRCVDQLHGPLYVGFGEADQLMSVASMKPFIDAVSPLGDQVVIDIHPEADHGYTWPATPKYNEAAATRAWQQTMDVFSAALA